MRILVVVIYCLCLLASTTSSLKTDEERQRRQVELAELTSSIQPFLQRARAGVPPREVVSEMRTKNIPVKGIKLFRRTRMREERDSANAAAVAPSATDGGSESVAAAETKGDGQRRRPGSIVELKAMKAQRRAGRAPKPARSWTVSSPIPPSSSSSSSLSAAAARAERWGFGLPPDVAASALASRPAKPSDLRRGVHDDGDDGGDGGGGGSPFGNAWKREACRAVAEGRPGASVRLRLSIPNP